MFGSACGMRVYDLRFEFSHLWAGQGQASRYEAKGRGTIHAPGGPGDGSLTGDGCHWLVIGKLRLSPLESMQQFDGVTHIC